MTKDLDAYKGEIKRLCAYIRRLLSVYKAEAELQEAVYYVFPCDNFCRFVERSEPAAAFLDIKLEGAAKRLFELCEGDFSRLSIALKWIYCGAELPALSLEEIQAIEKELPATP